MGVQDPVGQGPRLRGLPRAAVLLALRDAAVEHRDRAWTTSTATARTRPLTVLVRARRRPPPSWPGRRRRGRCRRTSPSPSGDDIDYAVVEEDGAPLRARRGPPRRLRARARRRRPRRARCKGRDLVGRRYTPLFPFFADQPNAFQVLAADFVSHRGRHRRRPPRARLRRGRPERVCEANGIPVVCPMDSAGRFTAEVPPWAGPARVRRQPRGHPRPQGARPASCATRPTTTPTRTAGAAPDRSSTGPCRRGSCR